MMRGQEKAGVRPGRAWEGVLCPACADELVKGFKKRHDMAAFVCQKGQGCCGGGGEQDRQRGDRRGGQPGAGAVGDRHEHVGVGTLLEQM